MSDDGHGHRHFIPAAGRDLFLPLYDPLVRLLGRNEATRGALVRGASLVAGQDVLDLGCGTGELAVLVATRHPGVRLSAIDPDPRALARAADKVRRTGLEVSFARGFGDALPWSDASFDRVVSSLVLHHLTTAEKLATLAEVRRVLRPGGEFHALDFGPPRGRLDRALTHLVHHGDRMEDNLAGRIPGLMLRAGFAGAGEDASIPTAFGRLSIFSAKRG